MDHAHAALRRQTNLVVGHGGHVDRLQVLVQQADGVQQLHPAAAALPARIGHFVGGFVQVDVNAGVHLVREHRHPLQGLAIDGVGRVRAEAGGHQRVVAEPVVQVESFGKAVVDRLGIGVGDGRDGERRLQPQAGVAAHLRGHLRKEVHVRGGGGAAGKHLRHRQARAVAHELGVHPTLFKRPDGGFEPGLEGFRFAEPAQQGHRQVAVGIHQAGHERVAAQIQARRVREAFLEYAAALHREDFAPANGHRRGFERGVLRRDGKQQTRLQNKVRAACRGAPEGAFGRIGHRLIIATVVDFAA